MVVDGGFLEIERSLGRGRVVVTGGLPFTFLTETYGIGVWLPKKTY